MNVHSQVRRRGSRMRGLTFLELLLASVLLAFVCAAALTGWAISVRAPANRRVTEMGVYIATQEMERLKARKYLNLALNAQNAPNVTWYDQYGTWLGPNANTGVYQVQSWVRQLVDRDGRINSEDLRELEVQVWDAGGINRFETARTLISFGGI